jgi:hypothetical protein
MTSKEISRNAVKDAQDIAMASIALNKVMQPFQSIDTEEQYLYCSKIHTALKDLVKITSDKEKENLSNIAKEMFRQIINFEKENP